MILAITTAVVAYIDLAVNLHDDGLLADVFPCHLENVVFRNEIANLALNAKSFPVG